MNFDSGSRMAIATTIILFLTGCNQPPSPSLSDAPDPPTAPPAPPAIAPPPEIASERLGFGEIHLGQPEAELQAFGDPLTDETTPNPNYDVVRLLTFPSGLSATVADGLIVQMAVEAAGIPTLDGVQVGSDRPAVVAAYGEPDEVQVVENGEERLAYYNDAQASYLVFEMAGDRVTSIACGWLLD
ncbi:MAG: hypothetical protein VKK04_13600 [Synechococcales bacterium]|nr:hypothetical protein [Synechococcales bacterium]